MGRIREIEGLESELKSHIFSDRKILKRRKIEVSKTWANQRVASHVAKGKRLISLKCAGVKKSFDGPLARSGISNKVGAIDVSSVGWISADGDTKRFTQ